MSRVQEQWSWQARCDCGATGSAASSDRSLVDGIAATWRQGHVCEQHLEDCAVAQYGFAKCTCDDPKERRRGNPTALPTL